jgi:TonB family protein
MVLLTVGAIAVLLSWMGISRFRNDTTLARAAPERAPNSAAPSSTSVTARNEAAPMVSHEPSTAAAAKPVETQPVQAQPAEAESQQPADAPLSPIKQVIPDIPRSALDTIRGTIRVSVRVIVDEQGAVLAATADDAGPSRYFERRALEAAKKWMFAPAKSQEQRVMLLRFNFTRAGTTALASPPQ